MKKGRITMTERPDESDIEFKSGLTWRALFSVVVVALLFIPINIYLHLSMGSAVSTSAIYVVTIMLTVVARYTGKPFTKQEMFILYSTMVTAAIALPKYHAYFLVYRAFFVNNPVSYDFIINGISLPYLVPDWMCPAVGSTAYLYRTLFQLEWAKPILILLSMFSLSFMGDLGLSIILSYTTVEVEKLRFPLATVEASLIETMIIRESERTRTFMAGFFIGLIYGAVLYGGFIMEVQLIPLPWFDLTWLTQKYMPGALIGIATEPSPFVLGLLLPISTSSSLVAGSVMIWIVLNYLFTVNPTFFPQWASEYYPGMGLGSIYQRTLQRIWIFPQFGFTIGLAAALVVILRKKIVGALSAMLRASRSGTMHFPSIIHAIVLYFAGSLGSVALFSILVPEIPFYIPLLASLGISFLFGALAAYAIGEVGVFPPPAWLWPSVVYLTSYQGYAGWFTGPYIGTGQIGSVSQAVRVSYLTQTKPKDYFKAWTIAAILNILVGLIVMDSLWRLAPIPSSAYPASIIQWPITVTNEGFFATRGLRFDPVIILIASAFSFTLYFVGNLLQRIGIPFSAIPFFTGVFWLPMEAIMTFTGSLIGHYGISRYFGRERWSAIRGVLAAGILSGVGVFLGISISMTLISKAAWVWPW